MCVAPPQAIVPHHCGSGCESRGAVCVAPPQAIVPHCGSAGEQCVSHHPRLLYLIIVVVDMSAGEQLW